MPSPKLHCAIWTSYVYTDEMKCLWAMQGMNITLKTYSFGRL